MGDRINKRIDNYIAEALGLSQELRETIDAKDTALAQRNFSEAYRLAGLITLLAQNSEVIDGMGWELINPEEVENEQGSG